jgi:hypothetical protein
VTDSIWNRFWFRPSETAGFDLAVCRIVFALGSLVYVTTSTQDLTLWGRVDAALAPWPRDSWMALVTLLRPEPEVIRVVLGLWYGSLLFLGIGLFTRVVGWFALAGAVAFSALRAHIAYIHHEDAVLLFVLLALAASPCGDRLSLDAVRRNRGGASAPAADPRFQHWALQLVRVLLAITAGFAGIAKLRASGLGWVFDGVLARFFSYCQVTGFIYFEPLVQLPPGVYGWDAPFVALAAVTVAVELAYPLALLGGWFRLLPAAFAVMLVSFRALLGPSMVFVLLAHAFWVPWSRRTRLS